MLGATLGARFSGAPESVRKYLGFALFSQAGVAVGLALAIAQEFSLAGPARIRSEIRQAGTTTTGPTASRSLPPTWRALAKTSRLII